MTSRALAAALSPMALQALTLARQFDPSCDAADAWIAHATHPRSSPVRLSGYLRSQSRRNRRAGGAHGPATFISTNDDALDFPFPDDQDPCELLSAAQQVAQRPGLAAALCQREGASDTAALADRDRVSRRRAQQSLAARKRAEDAGQQDLFAGSDQ